MKHEKLRLVALLVVAGVLLLLVTTLILPGSLSALNSLKSREATLNTEVPPDALPFREASCNGFWPTYPVRCIGESWPTLTPATPPSDLRP